MTQLNRVSKGLSFALCALAFLFFVPASFSEEMGAVKIGNKEFVLPSPKGFCESSNTLWGKHYRTFLSDLEFQPVAILKSSVCLETVKA